MAKYDAILVGAGLFNAVLAYRLRSLGKSVLVIEKRNHIAGNCYTERIDNIDVHKYGAHIFHTSNETVWKFVNKFAFFNNFINSPIANYKGELYNLPFNMNTFYQLYGAITPDDARKAILNDMSPTATSKAPTNLEEQALQMVGETLFKKLIKEYTEKQWGRSCIELPPDIIKRLPLRLTFDNNYFNDKYQGIPIDGYTEMIKKMYMDCEILLGIDYLDDKEKWNSMADVVYYSGCIDEYYDYVYGNLAYRSVRFDEEKLNIEDYQGNAVINYTSHDEPYTRIIEHKHFNNMGSPVTIISKEYSTEWMRGMVPYYPVNNEYSTNLYQKYKEIANEKVHFVGRLGLFRYMDMDDIVELALKYPLDYKL